VQSTLKIRKNVQKGIKYKNERDKGDRSKIVQGNRGGVGYKNNL
jgi:hypothetical protein